MLGNGIEMEMVRIPAGDFLMGSDKENDKDPTVKTINDNETPQHLVPLGEYWLGKTEVMVEQFALFVKNIGYPAHPNTARAGKEKHPVTYVSWNDAVAFCKWLTGVSKLKVRLPSEAEWEKGARGDNKLIYPWGNQPISSIRANYLDTQLGDTTPVGTYSTAGDSLYGLQDMSGNVWEWTSSLYKPYPYDAGDGRENDSSGNDRVVRGGAFYDSGDSARCAYRRKDRPGDRYFNIGFRCLLSPPL